MYCQQHHRLPSRSALTVLVAMTVAAFCHAETPASGAPADGDQRTRKQVNDLIQEAGTTPPEWWDEVELAYPDTLDLTWKRPPKDTWQAHKYLGQYMWSVINENPGKWREGAKLMHHVLTVVQNDPERVRQTMDRLASVYYDLLQDWPRAAFWWRKAMDPRQPQLGQYLGLARCYYKMGSKTMAIQLLNKLRRDDTRDCKIIRLWAEIGEMDRAMRMAKAVLRSEQPDSGLLVMGDLYRLQGDYEMALRFYRKVLSQTTGGHSLDFNQRRAQANIEAVQLYSTLDISRVPDGIYSSSSMGYAGDLTVAVTVKDARIEDVTVTEFKEKQYYSSLTEIPAQIIAKQSVSGIDAVANATVTSDAIVNATAKALVNAMK